MQDRLFVGIYPSGIVYADRAKEVAGDYKRLGFLSYATLELELEPRCPKSLKKRIEEHAATIQAKQGELFQISTSGQTVTLGWRQL